MKRIEWSKKHRHHQWSKLERTKILVMKALTNVAVSIEITSPFIQKILYDFPNYNNYSVNKVHQSAVCVCVCVVTYTEYVICVH